jgi:hypothetical protein
MCLILKFCECGFKKKKKNVDYVVPVCFRVWDVKWFDLSDDWYVYIVFFFWSDYFSSFLLNVPAFIGESADGQLILDSGDFLSFLIQSVFLYVLFLDLLGSHVLCLLMYCFGLPFVSQILHSFICIGWSRYTKLLNRLCECLKVPVMLTCYCEKLM